jgi:hypothetical protein
MSVIGRNIEALAQFINDRFRCKAGNPMHIVDRGLSKII